MKHPLCCSTRWSATVSSSRPRAARGLPLLLAFAGSVLPSACSGYYRLGEASGNDLLEDDGSFTEVRAAGAAFDVRLSAPDFTLSGEGPDLFRGALASVGDLDGDGRDEMMTTGDDARGNYGAHLRYGGPRPTDEAAALKFDKSGATLTVSSSLRLRVTSAGDVDGDGFGDVLIQTSDCDWSMEGEGAYLVYGGARRLQGVLPLASVATHFVPPFVSSVDSFGVGCMGFPLSVGPGDLDGDGIDDLVITRTVTRSKPNSEQPEQVGVVHILYGRTERRLGELPFASSDAVLEYPGPVKALSVGDVNGDGLKDLLVAALDPTRGGSYFIPGRSSRWSGTLELASSATWLAGVSALGRGYGGDGDTMIQPMDLDGDGLNDLLLWTRKGARGRTEAVSLFYGAPGLLEAGLPFAQAAASLDKTSSTGSFYAVGDRDADGTDDLIDLFNMAEDPSKFDTDIAVTRGSRERLSGSFSFPESEIVERGAGVRFPEEPSRAVELVLPAGDLDGDGAADLFTVSRLFESVYPRGPERQLHIHYGQPAAPAVRPLR